MKRDTGPRVDWQKHKLVGAGASEKERRAGRDKPSIMTPKQTFQPRSFSLGFPLAVRVARFNLLNLVSYVWIGELFADVLFVLSYGVVVGLTGF